ncbi:MAG: hypothetical protein HONBIEJF_00865 [Fimbriimonadaceae bacterium]|nr:hypothetical protein [Fimbriimonadaceae bacterium]
MTVKRSISIAGLALIGVPAMSADMWGIEWDTGKIFEIDKDNAKLTLLMESTELRFAGDLVYRPADKKLYTFITGVDPALYQIDPVAKTLTKVAVIDTKGAFLYEGAMALSSDGKNAYCTHQGEATQQNGFLLDVTTGKFTNMLINKNPTDINGWTVLDAVENLIGIDRELKATVKYSPDNGSVTKLKDIGFDIGETGGFTTWKSSKHYMATGGPAGIFKGSNSLYTVANDGTATVVGAFDATTIKGFGFSGIAAVPEPSTMAAFGLGAALLARRRIGRRK